MEHALEAFVAVTGLVIGLSHMARPKDWANTFRQLHKLGHAGAFVNGGLSLAPGAALVAGHGSWAWPGAVVTAFGWLLVLKAAVCFLRPEKALRSMDRGAGSPRGFVAAGAVMLAVSAWACYCLWARKT
ncbi:MAG: hypothetical protein U0835_27095 [Isosphaeraceae bacterium]